VSDKGSRVKLLGLGIVLLAFLLRMFQLGHQQLWLDEAISFHFASLHGGFDEMLRLENNPPLYYVLLHFWLPIAGNSEAAVRFPSTVAGTLAVLAIIWAGWQIFTPAAGLWAGAFAAVAPIHVYYSQEARVYVILTLELALAYGLLWRAMRLNTRTAWMLVSLAALTALYSHYFAIIGLVPALFILWVWPQDIQSRSRRQRFLAASLTCAALYTPWLMWAFLLTPRSGIVDWTDLWKATPPAMAIPRSLELFSLGPQRDLMMIHMKQFAWLKLPDPMRWAGLVILCGLAVWVAGAWQESRLNIPWLGRRKAWVASLIAMPLMLLWLISLYRPVYVPGRYDQVAFVGYALMVGLALAKLQAVKQYGHAIVMVAALGLVIPVGTKLVLYYKAPADRESEATARAVHLLIANGDAVVFNAIRGIPILGYYLPKLDYEWKNGTCRSVLRTREFTCRMFPPEMESTFLPPSMQTQEQLRTAIEAFLKPMTMVQNHLWLVLFDGMIRDDVLSASRPEDLALVAELVRGGYQPESTHFNDVPALYRFRRYTPGIALNQRG